MADPVTLGTMAIAGITGMTAAAAAGGNKSPTATQAAGTATPVKAPKSLLGDIESTPRAGSTLLGSRVDNTGAKSLLGS